MPLVFSSPRTTVLDCGSSRMALGVFSRRGGEVCLDDVAVEAFPGAGAKDYNWLENIRAALAALSVRPKTAAPVIVILPPHLTLAKHVKAPRVTGTKLGRVVRFEAEQCLPYALADVVWDSAVTGEDVGGLDVLLAAAKADAVESLSAAVQGAGFEPRLFLPSSLATLAAFRSAHPSQTGPSLVLNFGARSTTLLLTGSGRLGTRTLAFGGNTVTQQIAQDQDCKIEEAEALKLSAGNAHLTADARETFTTRLVQEITLSVAHFRRQSALEPPGHVFLAGGGSRLDGLGEALAARLKLPVDHLAVSAAIAAAPNTGKGSVAGHDSTLADLAGGAVAQLRPRHPVLNLMPPDLLRRQDLRRRRPWLVAAAMLAVGALLMPGLHYRMVAVEAWRKTADIDRELAALRERDARNRANLVQLAELKERVVRLQGIHDRRASWLRLLADLEERLVQVEDVWLDKLAVASAAEGAPLRLHIAGRMLDRGDPAGTPGGGVADRAKALLRALDGSPYVKLAEEGRRFARRQPGLLDFELVLTADPARPL